MTQLILQLEQPEIVGVLLADIQDQKENLEIVEQAYKISKLAINKNILDLRIQLRQNCIHSSTSVVDEFNPHTREDWTVTTCNICGHQLSRC